MPFNETNLKMSFIKNLAFRFL